MTQFCYQSSQVIGIAFGLIFMFALGVFAGKRLSSEVEEYE